MSGKNLVPSPLIDQMNISKNMPIAPTYSEDDKKYTSAVLSRISQAKTIRDGQYLEFGGMTYLQRYEDNRKKAMTVLPAKRNAEDVIISAGTLEQKLDAVLSAINNLNLTPQVRAYDKDNTLVTQAAVIMEDAMFMTSELDEDEEKKIMRQKEMLVQGEVFVEEKWTEKWKKSKTLDRKFTGQFKGVDWTTRLEKVYEGPNRTVLYGPSVYLGDMTQYYMKDQPYIFTVKVESRAVAESIFGKWENWQYVPTGLTDVANASTDLGMASRRWSITENLGTDQVEIIVYQDRFNDEYNILINGVLMLPAGFPLSAISPNGEYTIEKQVFKNVDLNWAYGRGFIATASHASEILDELLKLAVLKTRKSFMPPYINTSKKIISARVLQAGKISMGIPPDALQAIGETSEGTTPSEFQLIQRMQDTLDRMTVSPQFTGQQGKSGTTATEILELRKQAEMTLGLIVFACSMLEKKIGYLRLWNLIENWWKPIDKVVIGDTPVNKYRKTSREVNVPSEGRGEREVIPMDGELPTPEDVRIMEKEDEEERGFPVQKIFFNPTQMRQSIKSWYIVVSPKEKETSEWNKVMFREELVDMATLMQFGSMPNADALEEAYARVYNRDPNKAFKKGPAGAPAGMPVEPEAAAEAALGQNTGEAPMVDPNQIQPPTRPNPRGVPTRDNTLL